jgi:hypothetical protein
MLQTAFARLENSCGKQITSRMLSSRYYAVRKSSERRQQVAVTIVLQ